MSDVTGASAPAPSSGASSTAAPSSGSSVESSSASTTATPTGSTDSSAAPTPTAAAEPGPVPYGRFREINEQLKAAKDYQSKYEQVKWAEQFHSDPLEFMRTWNGQLLQHPQHGAAWKAEIARTLRGMRQAQPEVSEEPKADVPIVDGNGHVTGHTYSADQLKRWRDWDWQQKQAALDERIAPLEQQAKTQQQREQMARLQQQSWTQATTRLAEMRSRPYFKEHEAKVKAALAAHEEWGDNLEAAFNHVLLTDVLPTLSQTEQRKVVESLTQKAGASTVGPSGAGAATPKKFKSFGEAAAYYAAHPDEAEAAAHR